MANSHDRLLYAQADEIRGSTRWVYVVRTTSLRNLAPGSRGAAGGSLDRREDQGLRDILECYPSHILAYRAGCSLCWRLALAISADLKLVSQAGCWPSKTWRMLSLSITAQKERDTASVNSQDQESHAGVHV